MQTLRAKDYRRMPWKNGGGETREILISPLGATLDTLDWRVSLATIATDGPFSVFEGVQRTLCVIRGPGIRLQVADAPPALLLESSEPCSFAGEAPTSAELVNGTIVDLNVMSRRDRVRHTVKRLRLTEQLRLECSASTTLVFSQRGNLLCMADSEATLLEPEDCAVIESGVAFVDLRAIEVSEIIVIEISGV